MEGELGYIRVLGELVYPYPYPVALEVLILIFCAHEVRRLIFARVS